ncbi:MAG TPA: glycosyltransferase family 4 protein [Bryobacteraceae bacterium]|nr:glycosyltransferase family 4 protein [Bryobacteraceae bacterium]
MTVSVVLDFRFSGAPDGSVWTRTSYAHAFWQRYLAVFDAVNVIARVESLTAIPAGWHKVEGNGVAVTPVPHYLGPRQYLARRTAVRRAVRGAFRPGDAVIIRAPGQLGNVLSPALSRMRYPFGLEVGGDPHDLFAPGAIRHFLRPLFRKWFTRSLARQCRHAQAVAYVTESTLQRRYPCGDYSVAASDVEISDESLSQAPKVFTTSYSSVELRDEAFVDAPGDYKDRNVARLIFVGSLAQMQKGPDILLAAAQRSIASGLNLRLVMIGDGRHRPELESYARTLGIGARVRFLGEISGAAVRAELDQADLFVLPSRTEGLPRAMIEAMARGLPCIGTHAGGIVELLPPEDLVPPGDAAALSTKIEALLRDPQRLRRMSLRNLAKAHQYRDEVLSARRTAFYRYLRDSTESWLPRK